MRGDYRRLMQTCPCFAACLSVSPARLLCARRSHGARIEIAELRAGMLRASCVDVRTSLKVSWASSSSTSADFIPISAESCDRGRTWRAFGISSCTRPTSADADQTRREFCFGYVFARVDPLLPSLPNLHLLPKFDQIWWMTVELGLIPDNDWPKSGPISVTLGPNVGGFGRTWLDFGRVFAPRFHLIRATSAEVGPKANTGPDSTKFRRACHAVPKVLKHLRRLEVLTQHPLGAIRAL